MDWADFLSPAAILISAGGAWWFASKSIKSSAEISRKKSTFDYLSKLSWDKDYIEAKNLFLELKIDPSNLDSVASKYELLKKSGRNVKNSNNNKSLIAEHAAIKNILNEYEALAVAVRTDALDEQMVKDNIRQQFIDHIECCSKFIEITRVHSKAPDSTKVWCEVQALSSKWKSEVN
ncbi:MAG: DUF4760 domain-containing protein [Litoreibacter sp.]